MTVITLEPDWTLNLLAVTLIGVSALSVATNVILLTWGLRLRRRRQSRIITEDSDTDAKEKQLQSVSSETIQGSSSSPGMSALCYSALHALQTVRAIDRD
jgi:uncharacterized membrane protein